MRSLCRRFPHLEFLFIYFFSWSETLTSINLDARRERIHFIRNAARKSWEAHKQRESSLALFLPVVALYFSGLRKFCRWRELVNRPDKSAPEFNINYSRSRQGCLLYCAHLWWSSFLDICVSSTWSQRIKKWHHQALNSLCLDFIMTKNKTNCKYKQFSPILSKIGVHIKFSETQTFRFDSSQSLETRNTKDKEQTLRFKNSSSLIKNVYIMNCI